MCRLACRGPHCGREGTPVREQDCVFFNLRQWRDLCRRCERQLPTARWEVQQLRGWPKRERSLCWRLGGCEAGQEPTVALHKRYHDVHQRPCRNLVGDGHGQATPRWRHAECTSTTHGPTGVPMWKAILQKTQLPRKMTYSEVMELRVGPDITDSKESGSLKAALLSLMGAGHPTSPTTPSLSRTSATSMFDVAAHPTVTRPCSNSTITRMGNLLPGVLGFS